MKKKRNLLTNAQVADMNAKPYCLTEGEAFGQFRLTGAQPIVMIGTNELRECKVILEIAGDRVLWFDHFEGRKRGFCLNARIRNEKGEIILEIIKNEWRIGVGLWDMETSGNGIFIRSRIGQFSLILRFIPPETIKIERAEILHKNTRIKITKEGWIIDAHNNSVQGHSITGSHTAMRFYSSGGLSLGCARPKTIDFLIKLLGTSSLISVANLASSKSPKKS